AGRTRIVDHLAAALAAGAGALEREEALGVADSARAAAMRTGLRPGAGLGARARASLARDRRGQPHLGGLAGECLVERDLHVVAQVGAALGSRAATAAATHAENALEQVGESGAEIGPEAGPAHALLEGGMAEAVIGGALVRVLQDLVGLVDLL